LLERRVPLESLPAVEAVTPIVSSAKEAREKEVNRMKINITEQTAPSASTSKSV
jgi:hypothetical protein